MRHPVIIRRWKQIAYVILFPKYTKSYQNRPIKAEQRIQKHVAQLKQSNTSKRVMGLLCLTISKLSAFHYVTCTFCQNKRTSFFLFKMHQVMRYATSMYCISRCMRVSSSDFGVPLAVSLITILKEDEHVTKPCNNRTLFSHSPEKLAVVT